jgi:hypothetical protein
MHSPFPNPFLSTICRTARRLWLPLLALLSPNLQAGTAVAFNAEYEGYRSGQYVADAKFSLQQRGNQWVWYMESKPRGIYRWLTRKKPFEETRMVDEGNGLQLQELYKGDYPELPPQHSSWFDYDKNLVHHSDAEHDRQLRVPMNPPLYSYHSIHLLYADLKPGGAGQTTVNFFKEGEILESTITFEPAVQFQHDGRDYSADRVTHQVQGSNKTLIYYYAGHDLVPLKIEQLKNGELTNMLWRSKLN